MAGLQFMFQANVWSIPTEKAGVFKFGLDLNNDKTKTKILVDPRKWILEANSTFKANDKVNVGANLVFDAKKTNLDKYDFGVSWEPTKGASFGLSHVSTNSEKLSIGKILFYFNHAASSFNTVGSEFALDWEKKAVSYRGCIQHKFTDDTSAKFKVNQAGLVDIAFKHRFSSMFTLGLVSALNLQDLTVAQKTATPPIGVSLDLKF
jgi:beta-galactosidase/beta-glucuronidase